MKMFQKIKVSNIEAIHFTPELYNFIYLQRFISFTRDPESDLVAEILWYGWDLAQTDLITLMSIFFIFKVRFSFLYFNRKHKHMENQKYSKEIMHLIGSLTS